MSILFKSEGMSGTSFFDIWIIVDSLQDDNSLLPVDINYRQVQICLLVDCFDLLDDCFDIYI